MQLVESLCKLAGERSSLIADAPAPGHAELLDAMDQRSVALTTAISEADVKIADTQVQRRDGEEARGPALCLGCMAHFCQDLSFRLAKSSSV